MNEPRMDSQKDSGDEGERDPMIRRIEIMGNKELEVAYKHAKSLSGDQDFTGAGSEVDERLKLLNLEMEKRRLI